MIKSTFFILKYNIIKEPINLSLHTKEFFKLNQKEQRQILDKYFKKLDKNFNIDYYFNSKNSFYYQNNSEISFFNNYYFDTKIIEHNIYNIRLIDKFNLSKEKINKIIDYAIEIIKDKDIDTDYLFVYPDELPKNISKNINFMNYLTKKDYHNIKYITYNENEPHKQRELIIKSVNTAKKNKYNIELFYNTKKELPIILIKNIDFILYLIENDINNIKYIDEKFINKLTPTDKNNLIDCIIKNKINTDILSKNKILFAYLTKDYNFIIALIKNNIDNIKYIDWHNLNDLTTNKIINNIVSMLEKTNIDFNIESYLFKNIFYQNYNFMSYITNKNINNIKYTQVNNKELNNNLIDIYLDKISISNQKFNLNNFILEDGYINNNLIENEKMFKYLFKNNHNIVKYINFFNLSNSKEVIIYLIKEIEKKDYEFDNNNFLVNNKYPIHLSNNYLFMKYVLYKNFNNLAYIDISMIDSSLLKKIINYACRTLYYIRGNDKKLNFDIEGYFKDSDIIKNEYFQECLKCL